MNWRAELIRKSIHVAVGILPLLAWWLLGMWPVPTKVGLVLGACLALVLDLGRHRHAGWNGWIESHVGHLMRSHERDGLLASTLIMLAMVLVFLLLPRTLGLAAMLFLLIGDAAAGVIGSRFGRIRLNRWATLEGVLAGLLASLALVPVVHVLDPAVRPIVLVAGAVAAVITEASIPGKLDNLVIPLVSGTLMRVLSPGG
ncbi:MAG: hypothetical protein SGI90_07385 [Candidatus Eisenbacteria bacterium]|nr:hypothetical protein [Candidatus Eisenbacteria bacterium]